MWTRSSLNALMCASRAQWLVSVLVALAIGGVALYVTRPGAPTHTLGPSNAPDALSSTEIKGVLIPDAIPAVDDPKFVAASIAGVPDDILVIGVELGGEAHAFPIGFMSRVEIVNDRLGGTNIAVTW